MSASKVFQEEGGTAADLEPTMLLLGKLIKMGHPWTALNEGTERIDFLDFRKGFKETMTRSWRIFASQIE